jgi:hypothetical protein
MSAIKRWWTSAAVVSLCAFGAACSSGSSSGSSSTGTGGGSTGTGGSTASTTTTTGSGGSSTTGTGGGGGSSTTGTGGGSGYTCNTCLDPSPGAGAKAKECKTQGDACFANKSCVQLFSCTYSGTIDGQGNPVGPCDNSPAGACCTFQCYDLLKSIAGEAAAQEAITLYEAIDQCSTCGVCKDVCTGAAEYCAQYDKGPGACN